MGASKELFRQIREAEALEADRELRRGPSTEEILRGLFEISREAIAESQELEQKRKRFFNQNREQND